MNIKVYISGLKFMMCNTVKRLFNGDVQFIHSLDHGIYGVIDSTTNINKENLDKIKDYMNKMVNYIGEQKYSTKVEEFQSNVSKMVERNAAMTSECITSGVEHCRTQIEKLSEDISKHFKK